MTKKYELSSSEKSFLEVHSNSVLIGGSPVEIDAS